MMDDLDWADKETMDNELSRVKGNVSQDTKRRCLAIFRYFVGMRETAYGSDIGRRLKMVELNVWDHITECETGKKGNTAKYAETNVEIDVEKDMVNVLGTLHGACTAFIVDICSVSALVTLGVTSGIDGAGVSQSMNLIWHQPIHQGTKLRILSTSVTLNGRIKTARCEIWNKDSSSLCVSAVHSIVNLRKRTAALDTSSNDPSTKL